MTEPHEPEHAARRLPTTGPVEEAGKGDALEEKGDALQLDQSASSAAYDPVPAQRQGGGRAGRFWSARRVPAAVLALVVLGGSGLLLYDVAAVRADRPAMRWRRALADELARRPLESAWLLGAAAVAVAIGLWLLVLAVTPGLRDRLPMRRDRPGVRAALDRSAAALVLRDRAVEVSGVQSVRVRMGRSRAVVRAVAHFRELDDVRADLDTVLGTGIRELGLARPPSLSVHVRRPAKKG
ncbi:DUF6286 domain-containing protein [Streptomyces sp. NBC_01363]|uniref:DUF6286 domain-containing protein n=1 Tax=Streptomyces sp. NBC_01363 TaxID=2903840 RepID=UPI002256AA84|nr:DUF6286 domain-containing protein [Streptomyces sp. NBC_01363]MCX4732888.1 DUF6286 domain-containing protein [Streptomyces sp. NBC_01363]